jgi:hypothetical protein
MKTQLIALATLALLGFGATAGAQTTSTYERSCSRDRSGAMRCTTTSESANSFSETECVHRGNDVQCKTSDRESRTPGPTYEQVVRGGKTITIGRGMPR